MHLFNIFNHWEETALPKGPHHCSLQVKVCNKASRDFEIRRIYFTLDEH